MVRIGAIAATPIDTLTGDAADYDRHAVAIAQTGYYPESDFVPGGGPSAVRPPAYPFALAAVYKVTGTADSPQRREVAGRVLGALLGVVCVALIGWVAAMLWNRAAGLWAMAAAAVYPTLTAVGDSLLSEALFTPLVVGAVACVLAHRRAGGGLGWAVAAGILVGLASLTRTNGIVLLLPALVGVLTVPAVARGMRWKAAGAVVAVTAVVIMPWVVRNATVLDRPVISTQTGFTLEGTYNDASRNDPVNPAAWRPALIPPYLEVLRRSDLNEAEMDSELRALVADYIGDHPGYVAEVVAYNGLRMLELIGREREHVGARETGVGPRFSDLGRYAFWAALLVAAAALVLVPQARRTPLFVWLVPAVLLLSMLPVNSSARYREPADPFLLLLVGLALAAAAARVAARRGAQPPATGA